MKSTTYYASSLNGNDNNDGLTPQTASLTLDKVNSLKLNAGDRILLERGSVFNNQFLHLKNCGSIDGEAIEIAPYGDGERPPFINTNGEGIWYQDYGTKLDNAGHIYKGDVSSSVLLYDVENIIIRDIEIANKEEFTTPEADSDPDKREIGRAHV